MANLLKLLKPQPMGAERALIVGLGNPGPKYAHNRHNVGFQSVDYLAMVHGVALNKARFKARFGEGAITGARVVLAKPLTFMNASGEAVGPVSHWFKIPPARVLVIYDDLDLPLGRLRVRPNGSSGGHNGIKSIISALGTEEFVRLRVGIGRPAFGDPIDYVLNDFDRDQEPLMRSVYELVDEIVRHWLAHGTQDTMNTYNRREVSQVGQ